MNDDEETIIRFHGALVLEQDRCGRFAALIRFHRWDPTSLAVDLLWNGDKSERRAGASALKHLGRNHTWLRSEDPHQVSAELLGISQIKTDYVGTSAQASTVRVAAVQLGITESPVAANTKFDLIVRLQPGGILCLPGIQEQHYSGSISIDKIVEGEVALNTTTGKLNACETYEFHTSEEYGNKVEHRIQRSSFMGTISVPRGQSLYSVHEALKLQLDEFCTALSLCYRQPVDYYEMSYVANGESQPRAESFMRRRWSSAKRKLCGDDLINIRNLINGGLQELVDAIRSSPESAAITRAIQFLASSYEARLPTAYFLAFSAMETIVNVCVGESATSVVSGASWKKLERSLKKAILEFDPDLVIPRDEIAKKLPELKRPTLASRVAKACAGLKPKTADLWPGQSFLDGLKNAARVRNGLFHAADAEASDSMDGDLIRIRTFSERLLLRLLEWPDERVWKWYDQDLKWINQG